MLVVPVGAEAVAEVDVAAIVAAAALLLAAPAPALLFIVWPNVVDISDC